ncbi:MAG: branched-chain amino acid ABC transporter substrate-binding protein [Rhodocyclaceae bacterium]|nr:branched-chain amino acid ABC transporter substrate-binding protein [Rhodocyclaceae bacterium]MCE2723301.1 branched-chain amino acid ABC transporter substrate-binding protein [Betaproteobacteria bacterium]MCA3024224.1 branched-chain amino acid ABC transporter substrate-binding protein [Rhodocyclaceae bacterium]MCA3030964.1 branched-chain amino acid ABC transporter substrate-binding protein [Rhodocyclaceae bacterium]MCA3037268.1 branched-chain amino acid ABC transporter substrate-binding prot
MKNSYKLVFAALLAAGVVGCGKEEPKVEPAKPAAPAEPTVVVKIAHAGPLTKKTPHLGKDDENGVALAIDQTNAKKIKIDGKVLKLEMISKDDEGDPKVGTTIAQQLVDAKVAAVIGHLNSGVTIPASEIYDKAGIPTISGSATNPTITERGLKTVFRTVGRDDQQGPAIAAYIASELKGKKVAIAHDKTAYGEGLAKEVEKTLKAAKVGIIANEQTTDTETDFKAILTKIKAKNPDVVFYGGMDQTGGPMLKQARELGIKATFAFGDGACTNEMFKLAGDAANGLVCSQAGLPASAASKEFTDGFKAKFKTDVLQYAPYFYDATLAVVEAMKKANSVDPAKFTPELFNVSFTGATGKVEFDAKGDRKDAEITIFLGKDGKIDPVSIIKNGVATKFEAAPATAPAAAPTAAPAPAAAAPAAAPAKPAEAPKK